MYQQFYNFSAEPFRLSPEYRFTYSHKGYAKARAYLDYAFMQAEGFVMITGRPGTGKTTLIGALVNELDNTTVNIANVVCTQLQADDLLKMVAYDFGIPVSVVEKGELLQRLSQQLKTWYREGRRALLIVDEAQDLSVSAMEELRLLTNIQVDSRPLLQIFLLGQPGLRDLVLDPRLEQVHQRIIAASHLRPLESDETEAYIRHRLNAVHWRGNPAISRAVYPLVYKFSEGVPRRINLICSRLLLHCAVEQRDRVCVADVREVVQELQDENLASGDSFTERDFQVEDVFDEVASKGDEAAPKGNEAAPKGNATATGSQTRGVRQADNHRVQEMEAPAQRKVNSGAGQAASAPKPAEPAEKETPKAVRGRKPHIAPASHGQGQAGTTSQDGKKKAISRPIAEAGSEGSREADSGPRSRRRRARSAWSMFVMFLLTCILITSDSWI